MAPLKSLEGDYPIIDSDFLQFCASHGIFSVEDFLLHDLYILVALAEQYQTSDRLKQGITQILSIMDGQHQPWLNGLELLEDSHEHKQVLSTGCKRIDVFLQGGLQEGFLTELVGPSSSGKTQVCLLAASNVAQNVFSRVVFFDTGNSFSAKRVAHFVNQSSGHRNCEDKKILPQTSGHALMASAGFLLKKLAHEYNLSVLMTNHMVAGEGGMTKPALGESWKSIPHVRLMLSRDHVSNMSRMSILRHPSMATGDTVEFTIP